MPPRTRKATDETNDVMSEEEVQTSKPSVTQDEGPSFAGTFYENFDNEDHPDAVTPSPGQMLVFEVISSNIVPLMDKRTNVMVETEVVQILLMEGTTATIQEKDEESGKFYDTGIPEPIGEIRSLWINNFMLRKIWEQWEPQAGEIGALKFKGIVEGRSNEYQKWFGKFDKPMPRRTAVR